jgi:hypothetical protein
MKKQRPYRAPRRKPLKTPKRQAVSVAYTRTMMEAGMQAWDAEMAAIEQHMDPHQIAEYRRLQRSLNDATSDADLTRIDEALRAMEQAATG